jgi:hypothetical protein
MVPKVILEIYFPQFTALSLLQQLFIMATSKTNIFNLTATSIATFSVPDFAVTSDNKLFNGNMYSLKTPLYLITEPISKYGVASSKFARDEQQCWLEDDTVCKFLNHFLSCAQQKLELNQYQAFDYKDRVFIKFYKEYAVYNAEGHQMEVFNWNKKEICCKSRFLLLVFGVFAYVHEGQPRVKLVYKVGQMKLTTEKRDDKMELNCLL